MICFKLKYLGYSGHASIFFNRKKYQHKFLMMTLIRISRDLSYFAVEIYLSPIETHCSNIDYFPTIENGGETEESTRLHLARGVIALFILSFFSVVCAFFTGLSGKFLSHISKYKLLYSKFVRMV